MVITVSQQQPRAPLSLSMIGQGSHRGLSGSIDTKHQRHRPRCVSPALQEVLQWMANGGAGDAASVTCSIGSSSSRSRGSTCGARKDAADWQPPSAPKAEPTTPTAPAQDGYGNVMPTTPAAFAGPTPPLDTLAATMAIKNAVRLQPMGYRPGVMGGRVGLLDGLRTPDMDKYDELIKPKKRRAPPTDLSGLSAEEVVARRNRLAREYSELAQERRDAVQNMLKKDAAALRFVRTVMENAPGIVYLTISADMRSLVLHASQQGVQEVLGLSATALPGRSFVDLVHPNDLARVNKILAVVILSKNPAYRSSLRCRLRTAMGVYREVHATFKFGAFGIACSMWLIQ